jgi:RNAse (barnase) inhibitor barstar
MNLETLIAENYLSGVFWLDSTKSPDELRRMVESHDGYAFLHLPGKEIQNKEDLFPLMKRVLGVPLDLGENWDAFFDILVGFAWQPVSEKGYFMLFDNFDDFAKHHADDFYIALRHLEDAGITYDHNNKFYVLLRGPKTALPSEFENIPAIQV